MFALEWSLDRGNLFEIRYHAMDLCSQRFAGNVNPYSLNKMTAILVDDILKYSFMNDKIVFEFRINFAFLATNISYETNIFKDKKCIMVSILCQLWWGIFIQQHKRTDKYKPEAVRVYFIYNFRGLTTAPFGVRDCALTCYMKCCVMIK